MPKVAVRTPIEAVVPAVPQQVSGPGDSAGPPNPPGSLTLAGSQGDDTLGGSQFIDMILADAGNDTAEGAQGDDVLRLQLGDDAGFGGEGNDFVGGGGGNDRLFGGSGFDSLRGGKGDDTLDGGYGQDSLRGGGGADTLFGGLGDDTLAGGAGADALSGGLGADTFLFRKAGDDRVLDFEAGTDTLRILLAGVDDAGDLTAVAIAGGIELGWAGGTVFLSGITAFADIAGDIVFG